MHLRLAFFATALALWSLKGAAFAQEKGTLQPVALPPLAHPESGPDDRVLFARLPCRRAGAPCQRPGVAGDAAVAQPQLGSSRFDCFS